MKTEVTIRTPDWSADTRFTPGPWSREDATIYTSAKDGGNRFGAWFTRGFDDNGRRIENSEVVANATLAQSAPDMYAALKDAREYVMELLSLRNLQSAGYTRHGQISIIEGCLENIDAALAKAEGKS